MANRRFLHAADVLVTARLTGTAVLVVDCGPGWLELWSPNAAVRWRVNSYEANTGESIYTETGPASKARIWVGRGGAEAILDTVKYVLNGTDLALQNTGQLVTGAVAADRAEVRARFVPADGRPDYKGAMEVVQTPPLLGQHITCYLVTVPGGATVGIGFPPEERFALTVVGNSNFQAHLNTFTAAAVPQLLWSESGPANDHASIPVASCEFVSVTNLAPVVPLVVRALWQDSGPIQMT